MSGGGAKVRRTASPAELVIQYALADRRGLPHRRSLKQWADATGAYAITVRFVGAIEGRSLNRRFRGRDYATNVLTFFYEERGEGKSGEDQAGEKSAGKMSAGDIVLCAPIVAKEARAQRKTLRAHYAHLVIHGLLHLRGYDHVRQIDARRMEILEQEILAGLGYSDPYAPV
jgi:probable rRNA maturation factor